VSELQRPPQAVLLDLDGTLVDTERLWQQAYRVWSVRSGVALPSGWWADIIGTTLAGSIEVLAPHRAPHGIDEDVNAVVAAAVGLLHDPPAGRDLVAWRPGARTFVAGLDAAGVATAVVTSSPRVLLDAVVDHLGLEILVTVAGDEVARGKPDPEGYLAAARELEVPPAACVVVEDSPTGVAAGEAAGMRVLAVPSGVPVTATPFRRVVASLTGVDLGVLATLPPPPEPTGRSAG
jgi:beta-phosphoglucomutase-like phosphatase (HAD superfamily)